MLSGAVTIPPGASSATIAVIPIADGAWNESNEVVLATLAPGPYVIHAVSNSAAVTLYDAIDFH